MNHAYEDKELNLPEPTAAKLEEAAERLNVSLIEETHSLHTNVIAQSGSAVSSR